jgi:glycosyltransferase involved in cell wall biosynthesis
MAVRILAMTNLYPSALQPGRAAFNRQLLRAVAERSPLQVIAPIAWTDELACRFRSGAKLPQRRAMQDGIVIDHPRYLFAPKFLRQWHGHFYRCSVKRAFDRAVAGFKPDVVYGSWAYPDGWAAVKLGHQAGLPVAVRVHGSDVHLLDRYPARQRRTRETLREANAVVAPSADLAQRVVRLGADARRVQVIFNGVDTKLFHPGSQAEARRKLGQPLDRKMILFVGNLIPLKGVDLLIDACSALFGKIDFHCHLIGDGPMSGPIQQTLRQRRLEAAVTLNGPQPHECLGDWYRAADLLVLPSYSEGVPNVLLEAMACGTRFVATRVGGIPEVISQEGGIVVEPGNANALANAIQQALRDDRVKPAPATPRSFADAADELIARLERIVQAHADETRQLQHVQGMQVGAR